MKVDELIAIADCVGILLESASVEEANLYVLIDPDRYNLYIGKAASKRRHNEEEIWKTLDYERNVYSGFVALAAENDAQRCPLLYRPETFDSSKLRKHIAAEQWGGIDIVSARLDAQTPPTVEEVEQFLIRVHIRTGRLIGNSQFASQWEGPLNSFTDTVAVLAADAARVSGVLPRRTVVAAGSVTPVSIGRENRID